MNPYIGSGANNFLLLLSAILTIFLAIVSFGHPAVFDKVVIGLLVILFVTNYHQKAVVTVISILLVDRLVGLAIFEFIEATSLFKVIIYSLVSLIVVIFKKQWLSKITLASLSIALPAEIYWFNSGYSAPALYYYYIVLAQIIVVRYLLLQRAGLFFKWIKTRPSSMDYNLSEVYFLSGIINVFMIFEYLLRHLTGMDVFAVYITYEYAQQAVTALYVVVILFYTISHPIYQRV